MLNINMSKKPEFSLDIGNVFILGVLLFIILCYILPKVFFGDLSKVKIDKETKPENTEEEITNIPQLTESNDNILIELKQTQDKKEDPNIEKPKKEQEKQKEDIYNSIDVSYEEYYKDVNPYNNKYTRYAKY